MRGRLLERVVAVILIAVLLAVALDRLQDYHVDAERTAMAGMLGSLRSALGLRVAAMVAGRRAAELPSLAGSNPVPWLERRPDNYLGELQGPDPGDIDPGHWYFDSADRVLVYRVANAEWFETALVGPARARFEVRLDYADRDGNGRFDAGRDRLDAVRLVALEPYRWLQ